MKSHSDTTKPQIGSKEINTGTVDIGGSPGLGGTKCGVKNEN